MRTPILRAFLVACLASGASPAVAEGPNAREACRLAVAGGYLDVFDGMKRSEELARTAETKLAATRKALADAERALAARVAEADQGAYELAKATAVDQARALVELYTGQARDYEALVARAKEDARRLAAHEKELKVAVERVFQFTKAAPRPGGYPWQLEWRFSCPRYRSLCPLPPADLESLLAVRIDGALPEACQRYVGLSRARKAR